MSYRKPYTNNENSMKHNMPTRIAFWDNLKFFLILLVVIGHAIDFYTNESINMQRIYLCIYVFHMPLFIFMSGYFSKSIVNNSSKNKRNILSYLSLYVILKICFFIMDKYVFKFPNLTFNLFRENGLPWYMFAMSIWLIITPLIRRFKPSYVIIISLIISLLIGYFDSIGDFLCLSRIIVFYPFFILGYHLSNNHISDILKNNKIKFISILLSLFVFIFIFIFCDSLYEFRGFLSARNSYIKLNHPVYGSVIRLLIYIISIITSLGVLYMIPRFSFFISTLGRRTLQIYCLHYFFINAYHKYNLNKYIVSLCPAHWKFIYISLTICLTFILSLNIFSIPFKRMFKR